MVRVPRIDPTQRTITNEVPGRTVRERGAAGDIIESVGQTAQQIALRIGQAALLAEKTRAQNEFDTKLIDIESRASNETDLTEERQRSYQEEIRNAVENSSKSISIPEERSNFVLDRTGKAGITEARVNNIFLKKTIDQGKVDLDIFLKNKRDDFIKAQTAPDKDTAIAERDLKIQEAVKAGYIDPADATKILDELDKTWARGQVTYDITVNPETARTLLERKLYPNLAEEDRVKLLEQAKQAEKKVAKELKDQLKENQDSNMREAVLQHLKDGLTLADAESLLANESIDLKQYNSLVDLINTEKDIDAGVNHQTYNKIKSMIFNNVDKSIIQNEITESIGKTLKKEDAEQLLNEAFTQQTNYNKSVKANATLKIKSFANKEILKDQPFEIAPAVLTGKAQELEFIFSKRVIEENAEGQRIYEIADEVIDDYMRSVDPNYKPKERQTKDIRLLPEGKRVVNPATGEVLQLIGGRWVMIEGKSLNNSQ